MRTQYSPYAPAPGVNNPSDAAPVHPLRKGIAVLLAAAAAVFPMVLMMLVQSVTPTHYNAGGFLGFLLHLGAAVLLGVMLIVCLGVPLVIAWKLCPRPGIWSAWMFAVLYGFVAGWFVFDAANVLLDPNPPTAHIVHFVSFARHTKGPDATTITSWTGSGTEEISIYTREAERTPGRAMRVRVGQGALGRPYVLSLIAMKE